MHPLLLTGDTLLIHCGYMATTKRRLNITLSPEIDELIKEIAKRDEVPQATKVAELLRSSLLLEEDRALSLLGEERLRDKGKKISHTDIWG